MFKPVIDHFKSKYKNQNKFADAKKCAPFETTSFINLAYILHKNPKTKSYVEAECIATNQHGGNIEVTTETTLDKILEIPIPTIMLIEGAPGIGKTVVAREIAYRWAQKKVPFNVTLLLLLYLRENQISQITDNHFEEVMKLCYANKDGASNCAKHFINTQGENLMIIFDGYDEMTKEMQEREHTFIWELLERRILPKCHIIITSRPYVTAHLHHYCNSRVEIMGFTESDRDSYFKNNLSEKQFHQVTDFLQKNLIINSLCYIPVNLINFLSLVEHDKPLPKTQTELTDRSIRFIIARNKKRAINHDENTNTEIDKSIAKFAFDMLQKEQFVFSESEIRHARIQIEDNNKYGLLKAVQLQDEEIVYSFVHFSIQEYLAAYYLKNVKSNIAQKFALHYKFWDPRYFGVWKMYTGLAKGNNFPLQNFLSGESLLFGCMRYLLGFDFPGISNKLGMNKVTCLQLFQIFLEAPDSPIIKSLHTVVNTETMTINLSDETLSPTDTNMLSYFIARSYITLKWQEIYLSNCKIDDNKLKGFYKGLCVKDGRKKPIINYLDISQNCICELHTLINFIIKCEVIIDLKSSQNLSKEGYKYEAKKVAINYNKLLKNLDLSGNHFNSKDIGYLCKALVNCENLEKLDLSDNNFVMMLQQDL